MTFAEIEFGKYTAILVPDWDGNKEMQALARRRASGVVEGDNINGYSLEFTNTYGPVIVLHQRLAALPMPLSNLPIKTIHMMARRAFNPDVINGLYVDGAFVGRIVGDENVQFFEVRGTDPRPGATLNKLESLMVGGTEPTMALR